MTSDQLFLYHQASGDLIGPDGRRLAIGYSGQPPHVNDTEAEEDHDVGPIPRGEYLIGHAIDSATLGPVAIALEARVGTSTFGRAGFFIHGDSKTAPGFASHGCVILPRNVREILAASSGSILRVV